MAEEALSNNVPLMNDVEMKEEVAEPSVHSVPSAQDQIPAVQETQTTGIQIDPTMGVLPDQAAAGAPINPVEPSQSSAAAQTQQPHTAMEGLVNGQATSSTFQAQAPPVAQAPLASPLPATAAAPPAPTSIQPPPISAPTPPLAPPTRPSSIPPAVSLPPERPQAHGSPTRVYLNQAVTPHLLEGMKYLAAREPEKPLKWLSEFLAKRSAEIEGDS